MKLSVKNSFLIAALCVLGIMLTIMLWTLHIKFEEFDTKYELQVDSLTKVIEEYRIKKPDMVFTIMYQNMSQSNRKITHLLNIFELEMRDVDHMANELWDDRFKKAFEPWDYEISSEEFEAALADTSLTANKIH